MMFLKGALLCVRRIDIGFYWNSSSRNNFCFGLYYADLFISKKNIITA